MHECGAKGAARHAALAQPGALRRPTQVQAVSRVGIVQTGNVVSR